MYMRGNSFFQLFFLGKRTASGVLYCFALFVCRCLLLSFFLLISHEQHVYIIFLPFFIKADREETPWEVSEMRTKVISTAQISNINDETTETQKAQKRKDYGIKERPNSLFQLSVDL